MRWWISMLWASLKSMLHFEREWKDLQKIKPSRLMGCSHCKVRSWRLEEDLTCPYCKYVEGAGFLEETA